MSKWKPKPPKVEWQQAPKSRQGVPCDRCGKMPKDFRCTITTQTNWMRGDDEVEFLCVPCALRRGIRPSGQLAQVLWSSLTPAVQEAAIIHIHSQGRFTKPA